MARASSALSPGSLHREAEVEKGARVPKDTLIAMYEELIRALHRVKTGLAKKLKKMGLEKGKRVTPQKLMEVQTALSSEIEEAESKVHKKYGLTQVDIMLSQSAYGDDEELGGVMTELEIALEELQGEMKTVLSELLGGLGGAGSAGSHEEPDLDAIAAQAPADMTNEAFLEKFKAHIGFIDAAFTEAVAEAKREAKTPMERHQYLQLIMTRKLPATMEKANQEIGMDEEAFRACFVKFSRGDARYEALFKESAQKQERMTMEMLGSA